jgi:hypothetical protein
LTPLSPEDRALWLPSGESSPAAAPVASTAADSEKRQAIWWYLMLLALIVAAVEIYLANPYLGPRRTAVVPSGAAAGKENLHVDA